MLVYKKLFAFPLPKIFEELWKKVILTKEDGSFAIITWSNTEEQ